MRTISSRQNPLVRTFRELAREPVDDGSRLLLDGAHLVREAHAAGLRFEHVAVASSRLQGDTEVAELARALARDGAAVVEVTQPVMQAMSPVRTSSGIVAIASRRSATLADLCERPDAFVLAAIDVQDPGNVGALLRAAEAGGVTGVAVTDGSAHPFSWKAVRGSMGSALRLPIVAGVTPDAVMACAAQFGMRRVASVSRGGSPPWDVSWRGRVMLVIGGEGSGLPDRVAAACEARVTIPMQPPVESLNVAVAAALLVYEARRQRQVAEPRRPQPVQ